MMGLRVKARLGVQERGVRAWSPATWAVLSGVNKQRLSPIPNGAYSRGIVLLTLVEDLSHGVHW